MTVSYVAELPEPRLEDAVGTNLSGLMQCPTTFYAQTFAPNIEAYYRVAPEWRMHATSALAHLMILHAKPSGYVPERITILAAM